RLLYSPSTRPWLDWPRTQSSRPGDPAFARLRWSRRRTGANESWLGFVDGWRGLTLVAVAARKRHGVPPVAHLREVFGVDVVQHADHHAGGQLCGAFVRSEVDTLRALGVAELTLHVQLAGVTHHQPGQLAVGYVLRQNLEISIDLRRSRCE